MKYTPDVWVIMKFSGPGVDETFYKVLAGWYGGFAGSNSWKINSGIAKIIEHEHHYSIEGYTGSVYDCGKNDERTSMLTYSILQSCVKDAKENNIDIEIVDISTILEEYK